MGLADLHIHTLYSWDGIHSVSAVLRHVVDHTDLDVIAITDHDEVAGAWIHLNPVSWGALARLHPRCVQAEQFSLTRNAETG
jgi:histidinol phosphatase-like PHP family hydrolase